MMERLSLRTQLTLWYSLVFAAALFCIGAASLWMVHRAVDSLQEEELQQRIKSVRRFLEARPDSESSAQRSAAMTADYNVSHGSKWLQVIDEHGNWVYRAPHVAALFPALALPGQVSKDAVYFTYSDGKLRVRALIVPITVRGVSYTVQTGLTLNRTLDTLSSFGYQLSLLIGLGLVVSSLAGYWMSRKALTPIAVIAAEAKRINERNLNSRLPELRSRDELAALSSTLNQMLRRIEAGYQSVRSFTANAAHELRTPVALLRAETEVALAFPRDVAYYRATCERVLQNTLEMTHLIDQLLTLARADAGVGDLHFEPCDLSDLMTTVADEWTQRFADAGVCFSSDPGEAEIWALADYVALKRLLNILIENAWRYTPSGQSVALTLAASLDRVATIAVADTGLGIAPEDQVRVFERFYRVGQPLHGDFAGSGLGLVLAQSIAESHGSKIELQSAPGKGSRFWLRLATIGPPRMQLALPADEPAGVPEEARSSRHRSF